MGTEGRNDQPAAGRHTRTFDRHIHTYLASKRVHGPGQAFPIGFGRRPPPCLPVRVCRSIETRVVDSVEWGLVSIRRIRASRPTTTAPCVSPILKSGAPFRSGAGVRACPNAHDARACSVGWGQWADVGRGAERPGWHGGTCGSVRAPRWDRPNPRKMDGPQSRSRLVRKAAAGRVNRLMAPHASAARERTRKKGAKREKNSKTRPSV